jgi:glutamyl-Q tRNA(Asp) synthetase
LTDNTARQCLLQEALGLQHPHYLHTPLVFGANGEKLSKQNAAKALDLSSPKAIGLAMQTAASALGLSTLEQATDDDAGLQAALSTWTQDWAHKYTAIRP